MTVILEPPVHRWVCLACDHTEVSREPVPQWRISKLHTCPTMKMLSVPLYPEGTRGKVVSHEREDYINGGLVQLDADNRPVSYVQIVRDDGQDATTYPATAAVDVREYK